MQYTPAQHAKTTSIDHAVHAMLQPAHTMLAYTHPLHMLLYQTYTEKHACFVAQQATTQSISNHTVCYTQHHDSLYCYGRHPNTRPVSVDTRCARCAINRPGRSVGSIRRPPVPRRGAVACVPTARCPPVWLLGVVGCVRASEGPVEGLPSGEVVVEEEGRDAWAADLCSAAVLSCVRVVCGCHMYVLCLGAMCMCCVWVPCVCACLTVIRQ